MPNWNQKRRKILTDCNLTHTYKLQQKQPSQKQVNSLPFNISDIQENQLISNNQPKMDQQQQQNTTTPMIVERVQKIPVISFAVSMGMTQYDKLKSSNVTVGEVMTRAENLAFYFWRKVQPIVEKLPINKADKFVCNTIDYVEDKLSTMRFVNKQNATTTM